MGYAKGLLSRIYLVVAIIRQLQCILFQINQIVRSNSILALTLNFFRWTLMDVKCLGP